MSLAHWDKSDTPIQKLRSQRINRQRSTSINALHHHAFKCKNAEETRKFYEDVLHIPLVCTIIEPVDPITGKETPYAHMYFELGDGSWLAFFDFPQKYQDLNCGFEKTDVWTHHIALEVTDEDILNEHRKNLDAAGIEYMNIDHEYCNSIYFHDPNGLVVEFTHNVDDTERYFHDKARDVKKDTQEWMRVRAEHYPDAT
ncbi:VOC family protein [Aliiglaciecola sp. LCG003]|uniref:VOC family protein n=1 Tax=Aliiglaciecola sp. LCG003 TaxID=3053655 RepID=UPI002572B3BB|nr:VOC family protein [Aliiglaciecola sp. LCG003]WJG08167.1 VOC family protein [Aliiglaciecola sp. LCG003]